MFAKALGFLVGDCLVQLLPALPAMQWSIVLGALLVVSVACRWRTPAGRCKTRCLNLSVFGLLGFAWAWGFAVLVLSHDLPSSLEGQDLVLEGDIASLPEATRSGPRFLFDVDAAPANPDASLLRRVELTWYDATVVPAAGERWQFTVRLRRRHGYSNPGGYDYEAQLFREGIGATGYVRADGDNQRLAAPSMRYAILRFRGLVATRLAGALPDSPMLGLIQGLAVGERQQMSTEQWRVFAATGTSHLMAISGLHIAMVAALSASLGGLAVRLPGMQRRRFSAVDGRAVGCIAGALLYSALAGFGIPAQRTLVMLCIYCGARLLRRELQVTQGFALSLIAVLVIDPLAPLSAGAWLSFGAVGAILWLLTGRIEVTGQRNLRGRLWQFLTVQWAVTIGLLPVLVLVFGTVSVVSPLMNLLAIPFFTLLVVPAVLLGSAALLLYAPLGEWLLLAVSWLLEAVWPVMVYGASLDLSVWHVAEAPFWAKALLCLGTTVVIAPGFLGTRIAGVMLCLPALLWRPLPVGSGEFRLALLDVGQGLAVVVQTRAHTLLYDAGPAFQSGRDTGEMVVLPWLRSRAIRRIDTAIVSHGDLDHVGGMQSVLNGMRVDRVLGSPSVHLAGNNPGPCVRGQRWRWDGVEFAILHPGLEDGLLSDNNASCVLRIMGSGGSALLPGDIERDAERELIEAGLIAPTTTVVAAHHGSRTSSTPGLVDAVQAQYVLFATGYRNRWGFPRPDVVMRWRESGAQPFATATSGAIEFLVGTSAIAPPVAWRQRYRRYWHVDAAGEQE